MISFILNEHLIHTESPPGMALVDFIRYQKRLNGTKIGCREGDCGACTVLAGEIIEKKLRYRSVTCCLMPLGNAHGKHIVTVEGLRMDSLNAIQQAICDEGATQCGFCTPGIVMSLAGFCLQGSPQHEVKEGSSFSPDAIAAVDGNICRCTGYKSIERAALKIGALMREKNGNEAIDFLTGRRIVPDYFKKMEARLVLLVDSLRKSSQEKINPLAGISSNFLAGGTDLYVQKHHAMVHSESVFLFDEYELKGIHIDQDKCVVGASATVSDLAHSSVILDYFPGIAKFIRLISSTPIRNMATIAGNFVNASPIGDLTIFFLALDAHVIVSTGRTRRTIPLENFYLGYKTLNKRQEEFIESVWFRLPKRDDRFNFEKVSKRQNLDIASVNTGMSINFENNIIASVRISAGGVGPVPLVLSATSAFMTGKKLSADLIHKATETARDEISPISDTRGTAAYKTLLLQQLIRAHFITLFPDMTHEI